jgi:peptidyl-prolyl cis-trans isomerase A (cyclophilin A)
MNRGIIAWAAVLAILGCSDQSSTPKTQPKPKEGAKAAPAAPANPLLDPKSPEMNKTAPAEFKVKFSTSKGDFTVQVTRAWAPNGADRFYNLVKNNYYDEVRFFRVLRTPRPFMAQFGIHGDPKIAAAWMEASIKDDSVTQSNSRGMVTFATAGPNTRTTQIFINYGDNSMLDGQGFSPFAKVVEGMDVVDKLHADYGEGAPQGRGPDQGRIQMEGNAYLKERFPNLDYVKTARVVQ